MIAAGELKANSISLFSAVKNLAGLRKTQNFKCPLRVMNPNRPKSLDQPLYSRTGNWTRQAIAGKPKIERRTRCPGILLSARLNVLDHESEASPAALPRRGGYK